MLWKKNNLLLLIATVFAIVLLFDWWPWLRGPEGWAWQWWVAPAVSSDRLILFTGSIMAWLIGFWFFGRNLVRHGEGSTRRQVYLSLSTLFILTTIVQFTLLALFRDNPIALQYEYIVSNQVSGYFTAAQEIDDLGAALRDFPAQMQAFTPDPHPRSKPPGIILLYGGLEGIARFVPEISNPIGMWARSIRCADFGLTYLPNSALTAAVLMGVLTPLVSALIIFPTYGVARRHWGRWGGWLAAGLVALMPGRLLFTPNMDTVYPVLTVIGLYFVIRALEAGHKLTADSLLLIAGLVLSAETFLSLVNAFAGIIIGLFLLINLAKDRTDYGLRITHYALRQIIQPLAIFSLGCLSFWIVYWLWFGINPYEIYEAARPARNDLQRDYWRWVGWNLVDFFLFVGIPATLLAFGALFERKQKWFALSVAFWVVLIGLDVSGAIRAEVGRIWLMLAPFPILLGIGQITPRTTLRQAPSRAGRTAQDRQHHAQAFIVLTAITVWSMGWQWEVNPLEWPPPVPHSTLATLPESATLQSTQFGSALELAGYEIEVADQLAVTLYWQATGRPEIPYTAFVHLLDENGAIVAQDDAMPQANALPLTCLHPTDLIADTHILSLDGIDAGEYDLRIGLYDGRDFSSPASSILLESVVLSAE